MTKYIDELTEEQKALIPVVRDKWIKIGLSTERANRPAAEAAVKEAYKAAGFEPAETCLWADSPLAGARLASIIHMFGDKFEKLREKKAPVEDWYKLAEKLTPEWKESKKREDSIREVLNNVIWGQYEAGWLAFYDFFIQIGVEEAKKLQGLMDVASNASWWWAFDHCTVLTERPTKLNLDEPDKRLHSDTDAAVAFPDGFALYYVHGVAVPEHVIMRPETITVDEIKKERNAEVKRIMREKFGDARYLREIKAKVIDIDTIATDNTDPDSPTITRALLEDDEQRRFLVGSDGSTNRTYYMEVRNDINTCREAHEFLSSSKESDIIAQS